MMVSTAHCMHCWGPVLNGHLLRRRVVQQDLVIVSYDVLPVQSDLLP
jgi:hypothetical protein